MHLKKFVYIVCYLTTSSNLIGNYFFVDTIKVYTTGNINFREIYDYNSKGQMLSRLREKNNGEGWYNYTQDKYEYNKNGNLTLQSHVEWRNDSIATGYRYLVSYDAAEKITEKILQVWRDYNWINSERNSYNHFDGNLIETLTESWSIDTWLKISREILSYNNNHLVKTKLRESWNNEKWDSVSKTNYYYDERNNEIELLFEYYENGSWVNVWKLESIYDLQNNLLEHIERDWINGKWQMTARDIYSYNENNYILSHISEYWQNGTMENKVRSEYKYNLQNQVLEETFEKWLATVWQTETKIKNAYDDKGKIIKKEKQKRKDSILVNDTKMTYSYNSQDKLSTILTEIWRNELWEYNLLYTMLYDGSGNLIEINNKRWSGNEWIDSDGDLSFISNDYEYNNIGFKAEINYKQITSIDNQLLLKNIENSQSITDLTVYPNPFTDLMTLSYNLNSTGFIQIILYNSFGEIIQIIPEQWQKVGKHNFHFCQINNSAYYGNKIINLNLQPGVYYFKIISSYKVYIISAVKLK